MLSFLIWGLALNVYALTLTVIVLFASGAKRNKSERKNMTAWATLILFVLTPYAMAILCALIVYRLIVCKFDLEEYKRRYSEDK